MSSSAQVNPLRLLVIVALTLAVGVKVLFWLRDSESPPDRPVGPTGTASISGRVTDEAGRPVTAATIQLSPTVARPVRTDTDGRFTLTQVPSGRLAVRVSARSFLDAFHGETQPGVGMRVLHVRDGSTHTGIDVRLTSGAVVTGTIVGADGNPAPGYSVLMLRPDGTRQSQRALPRSDANGHFRIDGLAAGEYYVVATRRDALERAFHPSGSSLAEASRVVVGESQEVSGADIRLSAARGTVRGVVTIEGGGAGKAFVRLRDVEALNSQALSLTTADNGRFAFPPVAYGRYFVAASVAGPPIGNGQVAPGFRGLVEILVNGQDAVASVVAARGVPLSGRVGFRGLNDGAGAPAWSEVEVRVEPQDRRTIALVGSAMAAATPDSEGRFTLAGVPPGRFTIAATIARGQNRWIVANAASTDGRNLALPFEMAAGQPVTDVAITFANQPPMVVGTALDHDGQPIAAREIVAVPVGLSPEALGSDHPAVFLHRTFTDDQGGFEFRALLDGDYVIGLATPDQRRDRRVTVDEMQALRASGVPVAVQAGTTTTVEVRLPKAR